METNRPASRAHGDAPARPLPEPDRDEARLIEALLAESIEGQSVLCIGTRRGLVGLHAKANGAAQVTTVEANRYNIEDARELARASGLAQELIHGKPEDACTGDRAFDVVIGSLPATGARDPLLWISRMMSAARVRLVVEVDCPRWSDRGSALALLNWMRPAVWLPRPAKPGRQLKRAFLFTPAAIFNHFKYYTGAFEPVETRHHRECGTLMVSARRRVIRNLLVVTGPSSSGKSTLAQRLLSDPACREDFGIEGDWKFIRGRNVVHLEPGPIENLIVELDLMAVERNDPGCFDEIPQFHILRAARNISVLTVLPVNEPGRMPMSPKEARRIVRKCGRLGAALSDYYAHRGDGRLLRELYQSWFDWLARRGSIDTRLVINNYEEYRHFPQEEFDRAFSDAVRRD